MANRLSEPETSLSTQIREVRVVDAYCLTFRSKILHLHRDVTITGEGLQNCLAFALVHGLLASRNLYRAALL